MSRVGRPREFDRDAAVIRAMEVFWERGYEATTLADLQAAMGGITAPSFYAAFGSKEALFRETIERYKMTHGAPVQEALARGITARASIEAMLWASLELVCKPGHPRGCLIVLSGLNCAAANKGVEEFLREQRAMREKMIRQRLRRAVTAGDLPPSANLSALVAFYIGILDGLAMRARDGASRKALGHIVAGAMAAWDSLVSTAPGKS